MLKPAFHSDVASLYRIQCPGHVEQFIATTPETRRICNDPELAGIAYTDSLRKACAAVLKTLPTHADENGSAVINILRGGLNYGLREALASAYGWNRHTTCFISAQRARDCADSEEWHITENAYRKVYLPDKASLFIGDVVATGTSLRYGLNELIAAAKNGKTEIQDIFFFTIGGPAAGRILEDVDAECRRLFPHFRRTVLIYLEGCFAVPTPDSKLTIRLTGTDLIRIGSEMAPEFIESQYENPSYPIERCTIYDAGSRAFFIREYAADVRNYWLQVLDLAEHGITFADYLKERLPILDSARFGDVSLKEIALKQISKMDNILN